MNRSHTTVPATVSCAPARHRNRRTRPLPTIRNSSTPGRQTGPPATKRGRAGRSYSLRSKSVSFYLRSIKLVEGKMRKLIYGGANTLDNYIAAKDDSVDWILQSKESNEYLKQMWQTLDTIIMGRRTYEIAVKSGHTGGIKTYVCSRTLAEVQGKNVELETDAVALAKRLKTEAGKD